MDALQVILLLGMALVPPLILVLRLRNAELHRPEPYRVLAKAFLWGAIVATAISIVAQWMLAGAVGLRTLFDPRMLVMVVLVAPLVEELSKAMGLRIIDDEHPEPEDGYIYGGAVGLGFAAVENTIYVLNALALADERTAIATAIYRGVATVALHGAASAVAGYGIWLARYGGRPLWGLWGVLAAIALHVAYNVLSALSLPWATLGAAGVAVVAYLRMMRRVRVLDEAGAPRLP